ncbi:hypothetical protein GQ53DRAFT_823169 [Thozetella sp. PMI_491]|nr:hypothetical protein GQ53DRAFT_823169 [Thozetella sp. PMI_491]
MGWDEVSNAISVLGFISTIIALVGVVWGVYVAGRQLTISKARDVLGKTSLNGSLMGCYVTNVPHMWAIVPFWWKPNPPLVTSISALIQSGDSDLFSSAMFDWMPPRYSPVSWRPFYDAFYLECAWAFDEGRLEVEDLLPAMSDELPKERLKLLEQ